MPDASAEQLAQHDDVCAICYNEMKSARITPCGHIFHSMCLRKWLYVKESCPMCHRDIVQQDPDPQSADHNGSSSGTMAAPVVAQGAVVPETGGEVRPVSEEKVEGSECSSVDSSTDSGTSESEMIDQVESVETEMVEADRI